MSSVLSVSGVSKKYCTSTRRALWYGVRDMARELVPRGAGDAGLRPGEFWALDGVSFELGRGESLAVVGRNGAGKSTLLKVLYGLLKPDRGEVRLRGRSEALIELGTGIDLLLSGRENIRLAAVLHGFDRRAEGELRERVIAFTELGEFIDAPVQTYSAGMKARLAYAIAAHLRPDVLLVDEVLAVGDIAFQRKCAAHMRAYLDGGGSLLLVSHNTWHIQSVCERGILLERGRVAFAGTAVETLNALLEERGSVGEAAAAQGAGPVWIDELRAEPREVQTDGSLRITVRYRAAERVEIVWGFAIFTLDGSVCVTGEHDMTRRVLETGEGELHCVIPRLPLAGGRYSLRASIADANTRMPYALRGWDGGATVVDVRAAATTLPEVVKMGMKQLVTVDVDWS